MGPVTHLAAGVLIGASIGTATGQPVVGVIAGSVGAIFPDIDRPGSVLGLLIGHRTLTHKIEFVLGVGALAMALLGSTPYAITSVLSFVTGGISHLILDAITRSGIQPTLFLPVHFRGPLKSGSILVELPLIIIMLLCIKKVLGVTI